MTLAINVGHYCKYIAIKCTYLWVHPPVHQGNITKLSHKKHNQLVKCYNGNIEILDRNLVVLQINYSSCNFLTKIEELRVTAQEHNADVIIISESNIDTSNAEEMYLRNSKFTN